MEKSVLEDYGVMLSLYREDWIRSCQSGLMPFNMRLLIMWGRCERLFQKGVVDKAVENEQTSKIPRSFEFYKFYRKI